MNWQLMWDVLPTLLAGVPLTLQLVALAELLGFAVGLGTALMRLSDSRAAAWIAQAYVFVFRGTPLLVQLYLIYYGLGQFDAVRQSAAWTILREPYWCAILGMMLNTGAYTSEILRGAIQSVPPGQVEAARACGMGRFLVFRRIVLPIAIRQALPAYGNEVILMIKASSLASIITLMEVTGIARKIISQTFAVFEIFILAGLIYLALNFALARIFRYAERRLSPQARVRA
ncbi:MAG TPA: ABC transporter permease [Azospirillum sp.]|nr:ABC transporter permease [Azospirillum sp.]